MKSVTPRRHELIVRVAKEFLPDIIGDVLPSWLAEDDGQEPVSDIGGNPGLAGSPCEWAHRAEPTRHPGPNLYSRVL